MKTLLLAVVVSMFNLQSLIAIQSVETLPPATVVRERCLDTLRKVIMSDEFWPAMHAAEALTLSGSGSEVIACIRDRLVLEKNDQRRCGLARELVRAGDRSSLSVLLDVLENVQSTGRVHAAESLYKLGEASDSRHLRTAFEQRENPQLQLMAAAALANTGHADALKLLREQLRSEDRTIRNTVAFALARLGGKPDVAPLLKALETETDIVARGLAHGEAMRHRPRGDSQLSALGREFVAFIHDDPRADGN